MALTSEQKLQNAVKKIFSMMRTTQESLLTHLNMEYIILMRDEIFGDFEGLPVLLGTPQGDQPSDHVIYDIVKYRLEKGIVDASEVDWLYAPPVIEGVRTCLESFCDCCDDGEEYNRMIGFLYDLKLYHKIMKLVGTKEDIRKTMLWCLELPS